MSRARASEHAATTAHQNKRGAASGQRSTWQHVVQRAGVDPTTLTPADIKVLQRSVGNRATRQLLSPVLQQQNLTLGPADDQYEREADRVADQVVRQIDTMPALQRDTMPALQRDTIEEEEERLQASRQPGPIPVLQRQSQPPHAPVKRRFQIQRAEEHGPEGGSVDRDVQSQIQRLRGGGKPLGADVRRQMERGFGARFDGVRIHTGATADTLNRSLNARAFTLGNDIVFRKGEYQPGSTGGQKLLAHELTHTLQQGGGGGPRHLQARPFVIQRKTESVDDHFSLKTVDFLLESEHHDAFLEYARKGWGLNNVACYEAITAYQKDPSTQQAFAIFDNFFNPESANEINLPNGRQSLADAIYAQLNMDPTQGSVEPDRTLFNHAKGEVEKLVLNTYFRWEVTDEAKPFTKKLDKKNAQLEKQKKAFKKWDAKTSKPAPIKDVMKSKYLEDFHQFAKKEWSHENLEALQAIQAYQKKSRRSEAVRIYDTWLDPDGPSTINIGSGHGQINGIVDTYRKQKEKQGFWNKAGRKLSIGQKGDPHLFDALIDTLEINLADPYARWVLTEKGRQFEAELNKSEKAYEEQRARLWDVA